jgi:hypothetical protein
MLCYSFPLTAGPACSAKVSSYLEPLLYLVDQIMLCIFPHTTEKDSHPIAVLISKHAIKFQTHDGTCCLGVFTPKIQSLANSSMKNHISDGFQPSSPFQPLLKPQH